MAKRDWIDIGTLVGLIQGLAPAVDVSVIDAAVEDYLEDHPEITTTIQDGEITEAKLASALAAKLNGKQDALTFDNAPTASSANPVKSGGVHSALAALSDTIANVENIIGYRKQPTLLNGTIYLNAGNNFSTTAESNTRVTTTPIYINENESVTVTASGFGKWAYTTSGDGETIRYGTGFQTGETLTQSFTGPLYIRFLFGLANDGNITPSDITFDAVYSVKNVSERIDALDTKIMQIFDGDTDYTWILPEAENVVATWKNYLVKCEDINDVNYLRFSNDLGKTFTDIQNTYGDVVNTHFFMDGSCLVCFPTQCIVVSSDFTTVTQSTIYEYDGTAFSPYARHFYSYNYQDIHIINGVEVYAFGDYVVDSTRSRLWYTVDGGRTIKCMFAFGLSQINGQTITIRHVHGIYYNKYNGHWYIATGDDPNQCYIIQGDYNTNTDTWTFAIVAQGAQFKLTSWYFDEYYTYFCTDYTTDSEYYDNKGILRVPTDSLGDYSKYTFVYKAPQTEWGNVALAKLIVDPYGHKYILPDYLGNGVFWYADHGFEFEKKRLEQFGTWLDGMTFGPNYNGDIYVITYNTSGSEQSELKYNRSAINLTAFARMNGVPDFYKNTFNSDMISR